jgi:hypothetical protein
MSVRIKKTEQSHKDRSELKEKDYEHSNAFKNRSHKDEESSSPFHKNSYYKKLS